MSFVILHLGCLGVIWTGWSWTAVIAAAALYFIRMFFVTGIYHRYFSHKTYSTSRLTQFFMALAGTTCVQRGPLWWAYIHRHHHQHSDEPPDVHSPVQHGFWWSHIGWITSNKNHPTDYTKVRDLAKFPELVFLNRFDLVGSGPADRAVARVWLGPADMGRGHLAVADAGLGLLHQHNVPLPRHGVHQLDGARLRQAPL